MMTPPLPGLGGRHIFQIEAAFTRATGQPLERPMVREPAPSAPLPDGGPARTKPRKTRKISTERQRGKKR